MPTLAPIIHAEAALRGGIPFQRFMELALYCPECGFYEKEADNVGRSGDFYTSVSVGPLFGELLAFQFSEWWNESGQDRLRLVEAGAHDGQLAADVLGWCQHQRPELFERIDYCILEPSARRQDWQQRKLAPFADRVDWWSEWPSAGATVSPSTCNVIFANELLDAMPLRRFGWDAAGRHWFEWGVVSEGERFVWTRLPLVESASALDLPAEAELLAVLPDGFTLERSPAAEAWWRAAAGWLPGGRLLTFDYGYVAAEAISAARPNGTLRAYRQHRYCEDVLADPGRQDLTAHVDFGRIEATGLAAGLQTERFDTQGRWFTQLAAQAIPAGARFGEWTPERTRQFQTLTHPQHLGQSFRVLVQLRR